MRIAAGILLIVLGILSVLVPASIADMVAWARAASFEECFVIRRGMDVQIAFPSLLLMVFVVGSGISALKKTAYCGAGTRIALEEKGGF